MLVVRNFGNTVLNYVFVEIMEIVGKRWVKPTTSMEHVGFTSTSTNFHEFGETSGAGTIIPKILEVVRNVGTTQQIP